MVNLLSFIPLLIPQIGRARFIGDFFLFISPGQILAYYLLNFTIKHNITLHLIWTATRILYS